jgi:hypothetical protein
VVDEAHRISHGNTIFVPHSSKCHINQGARPPAHPRVDRDGNAGCDDRYPLPVGHGQRRRGKHRVYRANLRFAVEQFTNPHEKRTRLVDKVKELEGAGMMYCATVAQCNPAYAALGDAGVDAQSYTGKFSASDRVRHRTRSCRNARA